MLETSLGDQLHFYSISVYIYILLPCCFGVLAQGRLKKNAACSFDSRSNFEKVKGIFNMNITFSDIFKLNR